MSTWADRRRGRAVRLLLFAFACLTALPAVSGALSGFYCRLSPFLTVNSLFAAKWWVWFNLIGLGILAGCAFYKRLFCRYLCPAGVCFDAVSSLSGRKSCKATRKMPRIGYLAACFSLASAIAGVPVFAYIDPVVLFTNFFSVFQPAVMGWGIFVFVLFPLLLVLQAVFPGLWCGKLCPCGGLQDMMYALRKKIGRGTGLPAGEFYPTRRLLLSGGLGMAAGLCIPRLWGGVARSGFRPPTAVGESTFASLCVRCGSCITACPTGLLRYRRETGDIRRWLTPEPDYSAGYCAPDCTRCGAVCPSGAIRPFGLTDKKRLVMAKARLDVTGCLLLRQRECDRCITSCQYDALTLAGNPPFEIYPAVDTEKCVGCGTCHSICPEECFGMHSKYT